MSSGVSQIVINPWATTHWWSAEVAKWTTVFAALDIIVSENDVYPPPFYCATKHRLQTRDFKNWQHHYGQMLIVPVRYIIRLWMLSAIVDEMNFHTAVFYIRDAQILQIPRSHFRTPRARRATRSKLHIEDPEILGATAENLVAHATWCQGFVNPLSTLCCRLVWSVLPVKMVRQVTRNFGNIRYRRTVIHWLELRIF
jgi:hypothetical protein